MQLVKTREDFHSNCVQDHGDYEVVSNVKMMDMLSDGLYQDKIRAVIRELSTNAWDSHVQAGNTEQCFELTLPTRQNPMFRIRDYGTGMAPDKVMGMYRRYGVSDKTMSNEAQGCLGLGSKSPFAYTTQFTSISYYEGKKYIFINAKDERGKPTINLMSTIDTDEPNGFEVSFTTNTLDKDEFSRKASLVYRPFPKVPASVSVHPFEYIMEGDGWGIRKDFRHYNDNSLVIMGYVEYPIIPDHFEDKEEDTTTNNGRRKPGWYGRNRGYNSNYRPDNKYVSLLKRGLVIQCDIGEVEMDISREGLQYHDFTINALKAKMDVIYDEVKKKIHSMLSDCTCAWDARCVFQVLKHGDLSNIVDIYQNDVNATWQGVNIAKAPSMYNLPGVGVIKFNGPKTTRRRRRRRRVSREHNVSYFYPDKHTMFYVNDVDRGAYAACIRELEKEDNRSKTIYLMSFATDKDKQDFLDKIGMPAARLVYVSKLPKPPRKKRGKVIHTWKLKDDVLPNGGFHYYRGRNGANAFEAIDIDVSNSTGLYVQTHNWAAVNGNAHVGMEKLLAILGGVKAIIPDTEFPKTFYSVRSAQVKKFAKATGWTEVFSWCKKVLAAHIRKHNLNKWVALQQEINECDTYTVVKLAKNLTLPPDNLIYEFWMTSQAREKELNDNKQQLNSYTSVLRDAFPNITADTWTKPIDYSTLEEMRTAIYAKYPLLSHVDLYNLQRSADLRRAVKSYVKLIDSN